MSKPKYPVIAVTGSIKLGQFLKLANLVEDGANARIAIQSGDVLVNGEVETRRGRGLKDSEIVEISLPAGLDGAIVKVVEEN